MHSFPLLQPYYDNVEILLFYKHSYMVNIYDPREGAFFKSAVHFLLHFKLFNYDKPSDRLVTGALAALNWIFFFLNRRRIFETLAVQHFH